MYRRRSGNDSIYFFFRICPDLYESVLKNCRINKTTLHIDKPGKHTVKIICGDAGTVLQKVVLDFGGMKRSYMGPQPTRNEQEVAK